MYECHEKLIFINYASSVVFTNPNFYPSTE